MSTRFSARTLLLLSLIVCGPLFAQTGSEKPRRIDPTIDPKLVSAGFLDSHPDLLHRSLGLDAYGDQDYLEAIERFQRAAFYGDKPSQAIIGEMLWIGQGADKDRALAYIWMYLAAERGYMSFVEKRDLYWSQLDEYERARVEQESPAIHAEYADVVAEPRLAHVLLREKRSMTGSRLGSTSSPVVISIPGVGNIEATQYYNPKYWDPKQYREWQDSIWIDLNVRGTVTTSELEHVRNEAPSDALPSEADPASSDIPGL